MSNVYDWFEEGLEIQSIADDITSRYVPPHVTIFYCLGGITLTYFLIQVATGLGMTFYYRPTAAEAFASVQYIMTDVNFGWIVRYSIAHSIVHDTYNSPLGHKHDGPCNDPAHVRCVDSKSRVS